MFGQPQQHQPQLQQSFLTTQPAQQQFDYQQLQHQHQHPHHHHHHHPYNHAHYHHHQHHQHHLLQPDQHQHQHLQPQPFTGAGPHPPAAHAAIEGAPPPMHAVTGAGLPHPPAAHAATEGAPPPMHAIAQSRAGGPQSTARAAPPNKKAGRALFLTVRQIVGKQGRSTFQAIIVPFEQTGRYRGVETLYISSELAAQFSAKETRPEYLKDHVSYEVTGHKCDMVRIQDQEGPALPTKERYVATPETAATALDALTQMVGRVNADFTVLVAAQTEAQQDIMRNMEIVGFSPCKNGVYVTTMGFKGMPKGLRAFASADLFRGRTGANCCGAMAPDKGEPTVLLVSFNPWYTHYTISDKLSLAFRFDPALAPAPLLPGPNAFFGFVCACCPETSGGSELSIETTSHHAFLTVRCNRTFAPGSWVTCFSNQPPTGEGKDDGGLSEFLADSVKDVRLVDSAMFAALAIAAMRDTSSCLPGELQGMSTAAIHTWYKEMQGYVAKGMNMVPSRELLQRRVFRKTKEEVARAATRARGFNRFEPDDDEPEVAVAPQGDLDKAKKKERKHGQAKVHGAATAPGNRDQAGKKKKNKQKGPKPSSFMQALQREAQEQLRSEAEATRVVALDFGIFFLSRDDLPAVAGERDKCLNDAYKKDLGITSDDVIAPRGATVHWVVNRGPAHMTCATYTVGAFGVWEVVGDSCLTFTDPRACRLWMLVCGVNRLHCDYDAAVCDAAESHDDDDDDDDNDDDSAASDDDDDDDDDDDESDDSQDG